MLPASRITVLVNIAPLFGDAGKLVGAVQLAEELHQAKKLEAIGQLTAGIVHDFDNLLAVVHWNLELLTRRTNETSFLKLLLNATRSVERGEHLTRQLLALARKQVLLLQAVDLNQHLVRMSNLLQTSIGSGVPVEMRPQPGLWRALVDPNQIELVVLNLGINARGRMPNRGTLIIATGNATLPATMTNPTSKPENSDLP